MLDREGYRPNVGIILVNARNEVFWGKRIREHSWQFPQGGIKHGESPRDAMYRELNEEIGLQPEHVKILGRTRSWLRYDVPRHWIKREWRSTYRGQKQIWFLLRLVGRDTDISLRASSHPEFDAWRWCQYWVPLDAVIEFKRDVYQLALHELSQRLFRRKAPRLPESYGLLNTPDGLAALQQRQEAMAARPSAAMATPATRAAPAQGEVRDDGQQRAEAACATLVTPS